MLQYLWANTNDEYSVALNLFSEYAQSIKVDLCFQNFDKELQQLSSMYGVNDGGIVLCVEENNYIGCAALRRFNHNAGEIKRMYVIPDYRNKGIANQLLKRLIEKANTLNYAYLYLDTLDTMHDAINLYRKNGFEETDAYYKNPLDGVMYFKKKLI